MAGKTIKLLFAVGIFLAISILTSAVFYGTHTIYRNKTPKAALDFCIKCHPDKISSVEVSVHSNAGCICHGYSPNLTEVYNINIAHNLTKQIYCTNCHSNYTIDTGEIIIHRDSALRNISGINQSAHYIIKSSINRTPVYERAKHFHNHS